MSTAAAEPTPAGTDPVAVVEAYLAEETPAIREALLGAIPTTDVEGAGDDGSDLDRWLHGPMRAYPTRSAKHIRPALCLATCRSFGGRDADVLPSAVAIELLHNLFLVHDDITDASDLRRGSPTLHRQVGVPLALTAAGGLSVVAYDQLHRNYPRLGSRLGAQVADEFSAMLRRTMEGQATELGWIHDDRRDLEPLDYLHMVADKTCWYTTIHPVRIGALVGSWGAVDVERFVQFGLYLGAAFQVQDDILNLAGDEAQYGKEVLGDLREGKRTLMLIHLMAHAEGAAAQEVDRYLRTSPTDRGETMVQRILELMHELGSIEWSTAYASEWTDHAGAAFREAFSDARPGRDLDFVEALVPYMLRRER